MKKNMFHAFVLVFLALPLAGFSLYSATLSDTSPTITPFGSTAPVLVACKRIGYLKGPQDCVVMKAKGAPRAIQVSSVH